VRHTTLAGHRYFHAVIQLICFESVSVQSVRAKTQRSKGTNRELFSATPATPLNDLTPSCPQAADIIKDMGWTALFTRGLGLRIFMIGSLTGLQWGIYDAYKVSVGLPTTGSAQPAAPPVSFFSALLCACCLLSTHCFFFLFWTPSIVLSLSAQIPLFLICSV
jgi:hypothetical protein